MIKIGDKNYLEIEDYALHKSKTVQTIYNWIKDGTVKTRKLMGKTVVQL